MEHADWAERKRYGASRGDRAWVTKNRQYEARRQQKEQAEETMFMAKAFFEQLQQDTLLTKARSSLVSKVHQTVVGPVAVDMAEVVGRLAVNRRLAHPKTEAAQQATERRREQADAARNKLLPKDTHERVYERLYAQGTVHAKSKRTQQDPSKLKSWAQRRLTDWAPPTSSGHKLLVSQSQAVPWTPPLPSPALPCSALLC